MSALVLVELVPSADRPIGSSLLAGPKDRLSTGLEGEPPLAPTRLETTSLLSSASDGLADAVEAEVGMEMAGSLIDFVTPLAVVHDTDNATARPLCSAQVHYAPSDVVQVAGSR